MDEQRKLFERPAKAKAEARAGKPKQRQIPESRQW